MSSRHQLNFADSPDEKHAIFNPRNLRETAAIWTCTYMFHVPRMLGSRIVLSSWSQGAKAAPIALLKPSWGERPGFRTQRATLVPYRGHSINAISRSLSLVTTGASTSTSGVVQSGGKPLVVILCWLSANPSHVLKYASLYLDQGFDVLTVRVNPWQCVWPVSGAQVVAAELLEFLRLNYTSEPLMLHGFSVGGYLWGEVCGKVLENSALYLPVLDRVIGQVWDSVVLCKEMHNGMSRAVFPRSRIMQAALDQYCKYHLWILYEASAKHHIRSHELLRSNLVRAPALFLVSKSDRLGTAEGNRDLHDNWASMGVQTYWKCWDHSLHVGHYRKYPEEYVAELFAFLDKLRFVQNPEIMRARM